MNRGRYIVIEGPQGAGKSTQASMIVEAMTHAGLAVRQMREPDSQNDLTARAIRALTQDPRYPMNTKTEVLLYNAARSQSLDVIRTSLEHGISCIVDRSYLTTLATQYYGRGDVPDYELINSIIRFAVGDMEPDMMIVLDAEAATLKARVADRYQGERFDNLDVGFLERVRAGYLWEAKQRGFPVVYATGTREEVFNQIWTLITPLLEKSADKLSATPKPVSVGEIIANKATVAEPIEQTRQSANDDLLQKDDQGNFEITATGREYLKEAITNVDGNVYAFKDKFSPLTVAAAMARLSRRGDDMRITLLDEFAGQNDKDEKLLQRVITAYGDDSVQQLAGQHVVVENASNLLTKKLEWGRLGAYLEQSTRYIYYDRKDPQGKYKYLTPDNFSAKTKKRYEKDIDSIFDIYSQIVHRLATYIESKSKTPAKERDGAWRSAVRAQACDAARPLLPTATKATVGIFASGQALESLIMHLMADELPEAKQVGQEILTESRKVMPVLLERADKPDRGGATMAYWANTRKQVSSLSDKYLPGTHAKDTTPVTLVDYWPKNETTIVNDMLYEHSSMSYEEIAKETESWPYEKKVKVMEAYFGERLNRRHRPGRALEKIHYSWDLVCDYGIFRDLQRHRMVDDMQWQQLTPRYGYEMPGLVEEAGLSDLFEKAFAISFELYSYLQGEGHLLQAQYATLLGHKMRWKVTYNAREAFHLHELRTSPQGHPGYRKLVLQMHEKLAEVHPLIAGAMRFVNQGEDPELTRLAAERYTQYRLSRIS